MSDQQRQMYTAFDDYGVSDGERSHLDVWAEAIGHCSACRADDVKVAHIGVEGKCHVGMCTECVGRMFLALTTLPATPSEGQADG